MKSIYTNKFQNAVIFLLNITQIRKTKKNHIIIISAKSHLCFSWTCLLYFLLILTFLCGVVANICTASFHWDCIMYCSFIRISDLQHTMNLHSIHRSNFGFFFLVSMIQFLLLHCNGALNETKHTFVTLVSV